MKKFVSILAVLLASITALFAVPNDETIVEVSSELGIDYDSLKAFVYDYYGLEESESSNILSLEDYINSEDYYSGQKIRFVMTYEQTRPAKFSSNCEVAIRDSLFNDPIANLLPREEEKLQELNPGDVLIMEGLGKSYIAIDNCRILEVIKPE